MNYSSRKTPFDVPCDKRPLLSIVVNTNSFRDHILSDDREALSLLGLDQFDFLEMLFTPTDDGELLEAFSKNGVECSRLVETNEGWVLVEKTRTHFLPQQQLHSGPIVEGSSVTVLDMILRGRMNGLFVVDAADPFMASSVRRELDVDASEALDRVRVLAANCNLFYIGRNYTVNEGFYYLYRFKTVFRAFQKAYTVVGSKQLDSLAQRLEFLCRAADRASYFALRRADNDNQDNALYHTAFLITLITGVFEDLAWFLTELYSLRIKNDYGVSLRRLTNVKDNEKFFDQLKAANPAMHDYLRQKDTQAALGLFYPVRNQLHHRTFLQALRSMHATKQTDKILFILPEKTVQLMEELDGHDYRAVWNLSDTGLGIAVEPYPFVRRAVGITASIVNELLGFVDWDKMLASLPVDARITAERICAEFDAGPGHFLGWGAEPIYF